MRGVRELERKQLIPNFRCMNMPRGTVTGIFRTYAQHKLHWQFGECLIGELTNAN